MLDELDEKLRVKFEVPPEDTAAIRSKLESVAHLVKPEVVLDVVMDDPDDSWSAQSLDWPITLPAAIGICSD